jgi:hypothetical protein
VNISIKKQVKNHIAGEIEESSVSPTATKQPVQLPLKYNGHSS